MKASKGRVATQYSYLPVMPVNLVHLWRAYLGSNQHLSSWTLGLLFLSPSCLQGVSSQLLLMYHTWLPTRIPAMMT